LVTAGNLPNHTNPKRTFTSCTLLPKHEHGIPQSQTHLSRSKLMDGYYEHYT